MGFRRGGSGRGPRGHAPGGLRFGPGGPSGPWLCMQRRPTADYRGDCVLEDELFLRVVLQQHRVFVEGPNAPCQLDTADQINSDGAFVLANSVEKSVLNILR